MPELTRFTRPRTIPIRMAGESVPNRLVELGVWLDEGYGVPSDERGDVP